MKPWLGVDLEDHVGLFDPQAHGDVPRRAAAIDEVDLFALDAMRFVRTLGRDVAATPTSKRGRALVVMRASVARGGYREGRELSRAEETLGASAWLVQAADPRVLATEDALDREAFEALEADPTVAAVFDEHAVRAALAASQADTGLYRWSSREASSDAYVRTQAPDAPICARDLPITLRRAIERTRLRTAFATRRDLSLRSALGRDRFARRPTTPQSREDAEWDALVARSRGRPLPDGARALITTLLAILGAAIVLLAMWALFFAPAR